MSGDENQQMPTDNQVNQERRDEMFRWANRGRWDEAKEFYKVRSWQGEKHRITEDTLLHMAVSARREDVVNDLLQLVADFEILRLRNKNGDTPLHLAAGLGLVNACECMFDKCPDMIEVRNEKGETPIFAAALNDSISKDVFHTLRRTFWPHFPRDNDNLEERVMMDEEDEEVLEILKLCQRESDGQTILHCAISGENFDLALSILSFQPLLAIFEDKKGYTPLHILAQRPLAFRSGTSLGIVDSIIYAGLSPYPLGDYEIDDSTCCGVGISYEIWSKFVSLLAKPFILLGFALSYISNIYILVVLRLKYCILFAIGRTHMMNQQPSTTSVEEGGPSTAMDTHADNESIPTFPAFVEHMNLFAYLPRKFSNPILALLGTHVRRIKRIVRMKHNHVLALKTMRFLLTVKVHCSKPVPGDNDLDSRRKDGIETPLLIAAREGVTEMVKFILFLLPDTIHDERIFDRKNIVLVAVVNRRVNVFEYLLSKKKQMVNAFEEVDKEGNNALHLAARRSSLRPQHMPGELMQMHWEIKWYEYVRDSMPESFETARNDDGITPWEVFEETHREHMEKAEWGGEWMNKLSQSCSVVASLITTVAYASATNFPGGNNGQGSPNFQGHPAFNTFIVSSFTALIFSLLSLVMFLTALLSGSAELKSFSKMAEKLIIGISSLLISIGSMLVSFCAGHFFLFKGKIKWIALPIYVAACVPIYITLVRKFPLYWNIQLFSHKPVKWDPEGVERRDHPPRESKIPTFRRKRGFMVLRERQKEKADSERVNG